MDYIKSDYGPSKNLLGESSYRLLYPLKQKTPRTSGPTSYAKFLQIMDE